MPHVANIASAARAESADRPSLLERPSTALDESRLAAFFADHGRDLPWRRPDVTPWAVLVSEVMLQQTPVSRVLPAYQEWMRRWPTPEALAAAPAGDAVRAWGRLGYPRRALRLHRAAQEITGRHQGTLPDDLGVLLELPGAGEYTARAVAAFAFGRRVPVVDTNVRRVLSRAVRGVDESGPATAADRAELEQLLPGDPAAAARFSVALMELGALLCTAARPDCPRCPLSDQCAWLAAGRPPGPTRRPGQPWHGTDRLMRGAILAVLRAADGPVARATLLDGERADQRRRCLDSLLADGLAVRTSDGGIALPS